MSVSSTLLVFDMDGVLVDVHASYRETIRETVRRFTGREISHELIQDYKNQGGWNNDWQLSQRICEDLGTPVEYDVVVREFQKLFMGDGTQPGLIEREKWIATPGMLEALNQKYNFAIFTGRLQDEAQVTLRRFASHLRFAPVLSDEMVTRSKPAPDGLLQIAEERPDASLLYIGDTVDDARSARDARVAFVGIAAPSNTRYEELTSLLRAEGALAILPDINGLPALLQQGPLA